MSKWWDKDSLGAVSFRPSPTPTRQRAGLRSVELILGARKRLLQHDAGVLAKRPGVPMAEASRLAKQASLPTAATQVARRAMPQPSRAATVVPPPRRPIVSSKGRPSAPARRAPTRGIGSMLSTRALGGLLDGLFGDANADVAQGNVDIFNVPDGWIGKNFCWITNNLWDGIDASLVPHTNGVPWIHRLAFPVLDNTQVVDLLITQGVQFGTPVPSIPVPIPQFLLAGYKWNASAGIVDGFDYVDSRALRGEPLPRDTFGGGRPSWWGEEQPRTRDGQDLNWTNGPPRAGSLSMAPVVTTMHFVSGLDDADRVPALVMPISGFVEGITVGPWVTNWAQPGRVGFQDGSVSCDFWSADGSTSAPKCFSPFGYPIDLISYYVAGIPSDEQGSAITDTLRRWLSRWGYLNPPKGYPAGIGGMTLYDTGGRRMTAVPTTVAVPPAADAPPVEPPAVDDGFLDPTLPADGGLPAENPYHADPGLPPEGGSVDPAYYDPNYNPGYPTSQGSQDGFNTDSYAPSLPSANEAVFDLVPVSEGEDAGGAIADLRLSDLSPAELEQLGLWVDADGFVHDQDGSYLDDSGYPVLDASGQPVGTVAPLEESPIYSGDDEDPIAPYAGESW